MASGYHKAEDERPLTTFERWGLRLALLAGIIYLLVYYVTLGSAAVKIFGYLKSVFVTAIHWCCS